MATSDPTIERTTSTVSATSDERVEAPIVLTDSPPRPLRFFDQFAMKLALEHGGAEHRPVGESTTAVPIERYCRQLIRCG